jgi:antirestriction protein ArdC
MANQEELRQKITDQIVESLKSGGIPPWRRPWGISPNSGFPVNVVSKRRYSGVNVLLLRMAAMQHGHTSKYWATFNQWRDMGGRIQRRPDHVKPGSWGQSIVFFTKVTKTEVDPTTGEEEETSFPLLRTYTVFNVDQVDGPFDHLRVKEESLTVNTSFVNYQPVEDLLDAVGADIRFGGDRAFYNRAGDYIQLPPKHRFEKEHEYYGVVAHEIIHFTESRCNWTGSYPEGELRAEIGGAFLLAARGVQQSDDLSNHKAYVASWLEALNKDSRFIFRAASAASKAADYILSFAPQHQPEPDLVEVPF